MCRLRLLLQGKGSFCWPQGWLGPSACHLKGWGQFWNQNFELLGQYRTFVSICGFIYMRSFFKVLKTKSNWTSLFKSLFILRNSTLQILCGPRRGSMYSHSSGPSGMLNSLAFMMENGAVKSVCAELKKLVTLGFVHLEHLFSIVMETWCSVCIEQIEWTPEGNHQRVDSIPHRNTRRSDERFFHIFIFSGMTLKALPLENPEPPNNSFFQALERKKWEICTLKWMSLAFLTRAKKGIEDSMGMWLGGKVSKEYHTTLISCGKVYLVSLFPALWF